VTRFGRVRGTLSGGLGANYWRLWLSSAAANLADGIFWIAFPLLAIQYTDSPALVAGVVLVGRLPWLFFVLIAGALADRLDRRRTMLAVAVMRTLVAAGLAIGVVADVVDLPVLYLTSFALGVGETLFDTAAQSVMPSVVERDQVSKANGRLFAAELTANQFIGPPLGGLLASIAIAYAFAGAAIAFVVGVLGLALMRGSFRPVAATGETSIVEDIREGLRYLRGHRVLRTMALMVGGANLASSATFAIMVLYVVAPGPVGLDEVGFGVLMTTMAIGSVAGSLLADRTAHWLGRPRLLFVSILLMALTTAVPGLTTAPLAIGAALALGSLAVLMWNVVTVTLRQRIVPDRLLGRVNASYRLLAWGSQPLGALLGGLIGELLGLQAVFLIAGAWSLLLLLGNRVLTEDALVAAEAEGEAEAARLAAESAAVAAGPAPAVSASSADASPASASPLE
jgi:MFS family permease